jgi:DNA modification methylase
LKHTGSLVVNIGDTNKTENSEKALTPFLFATKMKEKGWHVAGVYIWIKNNFRPTLSENKAITTFEYIFHFAKSSEYSYYKDWMSETTDPIYNKLIFGKNNKRSLKDVLDLRTEFFDGIINTNCSNTINLTNECKKKGVVMNHTATFPILIPSIFVNLTTKPGDLVIDGFNGTGTTGAACQILGRNYVGFELNKNYIDISQVRMEYVEDVLREAA